MTPYRWYFTSRRVFKVDPRKFQIAAIRKRNGVRVSNFQDFLVSMISTSVLNKKKIYFVWCTPLFELGWNDPEGCPYIRMYSAFHIMQWFSQNLCEDPENQMIFCDFNIFVNQNKPSLKQDLN